MSVPSLTGKTCPYCQGPLDSGAELVVCTVCGVAQHRACWQENGRCATFGCTGAPYALSGGQQLSAALPKPPNVGMPPPPIMPMLPPQYQAPGYPLARPQLCPLAIAALVLGILSVLCGLLAGVPAIVCGIIALAQINNSQGRLTGNAQAIVGIVVPLVMIPLGFVLGTVVERLIP